MIIDTRNHTKDGKPSIIQAVADTMNSINMDDTISIEWLILPNGEKKSPEYIRPFITALTGGKPFFKTRKMRGNLVVWRIAEINFDVRLSKGAPAKWPLHSMNVGDTITASVGQYGKSNPAIYPHTYGAKMGMKFKVNKDGVKYYITRIS